MDYDNMVTGRFYLNGDVSVTLEERIKTAARSYFEKSGTFPNLAHVNPEIVNIPCIVTVDGKDIRVVPDPMMNTFIAWVGIGKDC